MQPGPNPEDINTILSRFQSWAEKHPSEGNGNGNGHKNGAGSDSDEIREIPYEEAIRQYRSRHGQTPRRAAAAKPRIRTGSAQKPAMQTEKPLMKKEPNPPAVEMEAEALPQWVSELPLVADSEPVIELRAAVQPAPVVAEQVVQARTQVAIDLEEATEVVQRAMEGVRKKRNTTPPKTKPEPEKLAAMAAKAETPARASVAPARAATVASPTPVAKPERKAPQKPSQARSAATRPPQARLAPTPPIPAIRKAASAGQPVKAQARMARPNPKSSIIKAQIKTAAQPPAPRIARAAGEVARAASSWTQKRADSTSHSSQTATRAIPQGAGQYCSPGKNLGGGEEEKAGSRPDTTHHHTVHRGGGAADREACCRGPTLPSRPTSGNVRWRWSLRRIHSRCRRSRRRRPGRAMRRLLSNISRMRIPCRHRLCWEAGCRFCAIDSLDHR
jgi:hypothetical protein